MATTFRTREGDQLDSLCYQRYGYLDGCVEAVLDANPGLAAAPQPLPGGVLVRFPELTAPSGWQVRLWD